MKGIRFIAFSLIFSYAVAADPIVLLSHGGQLRGKQFSYNGTDVAIFIGIPYAKAPVGELRFKKPEAYPAWTGIKDVKTPSDNCPQVGVTQQDAIPSGNEDCLHLDITIPGTVNSSNKKPVMVWIHGGGYVIGSKTAYIGAPLAVSGDVIVVAINYRLGILGFLFDGSSTGNFGLWDQRAALLWVKENIGQFGGDPDLVTIFGESAGAASVSAQLMSPHNEGLFKRAIQESGTMYVDWSWHLSQNQLYKIAKSTKEHNKCPSDESVYKCLGEMTVENLFANVKSDNLLVNYWHPVADDDFFSSNIEEETLDLADRFDLMVGFNGQEGQSLTAYILQFGGNLTTGLSLENVRQILATYNCLNAARMSIELCVDFMISLYGLESAPDDRERAIRLSYLQGEFNFIVDSVKQLSIHSADEKSTYAYYFTQVYNPPDDAFEFVVIPNWLKKSADHFHEVPFVFGALYTNQFDVVKEYIGAAELSTADKPIFKYWSASVDAEKELTDLMMTMWTNFAKSGNPNLPVPLPAGTPTWPQFNTDSNMFMELNSTNVSVITTPNKERLERVQSTLFNARRLQVAADNAPAKMDCDDDDDGADDDDDKTKVDDGNAAVHRSASTVLMLFLYLLPVVIRS